MIDAAKYWSAYDQYLVRNSRRNPSGAATVSASVVLPFEGKEVSPTENLDGGCVLFRPCFTNRKRDADRRA